MNTLPLIVKVQIGELGIALRIGSIVFHQPELVGVYDILPKDLLKDAPTEDHILSWICSNDFQYSVDMRVQDLACKASGAEVIGAIRDEF